MPVGWKLEERCRAALLRRFPPRYPRVIADHVTLNLHDRAPPCPVGEAQVIGRCDDDAGVEALVVRIDGSTARPDGLIWHITWSLADGRAPRESNGAIATLGWIPVEPFPLGLVPALW